MKLHSTIYNPLTDSSTRSVAAEVSTEGADIVIEAVRDDSGNLVELSDREEMELGAKLWEQIKQQEAERYEEDI